MQIFYVFSTLRIACVTTTLSNNISVVNTWIPILHGINKDYKWSPINSGQVLMPNEFVPNFLIKTFSFKSFLVFLLSVKELWISGTGKAEFEWKMLALVFYKTFSLDSNLQRRQRLLVCFLTKRQSTENRVESLMLDSPLLLSHLFPFVNL